MKDARCRKRTDIRTTEEQRMLVPHLILIIKKLIILFVYSLLRMVPLYTSAVNIQVNGDSFYVLQ